MQFVASKGDQNSSEAKAEEVITNLMDMSEDDNAVIAAYMRKNLCSAYAILEQGRKLTGYDIMTTMICLCPTIVHAAPKISCALAKGETKRSLAVSSLIVSNSGTHKDTLMFAANILRDFAASVLKKRGGGELIGEG